MLQLNSSNKYRQLSYKYKGLIILKCIGPINTILIYNFKTNFPTYFECDFQIRQKLKNTEDILSMQHFTDALRYAG